MSNFYLFLILLLTTYCCSSCNTQYQSQTLEYEPIFIDAEQQVKGVFYRLNVPSNKNKPIV